MKNLHLLNYIKMKQETRTFKFAEVQYIRVTEGMREITVAETFENDTERELTVYLLRYSISE